MKKIASVFCLSLLLIAGTAFAQTGGITGSVVDLNGAAVEGARVSLQTSDTCTYVLTDANGEYTFTDVAVGTYTLNAGLRRVGHASVDGVEVIDGQVTNVETLTLAGSGPNGSGGRPGRRSGCLYRR